MKPSQRVSFSVNRPGCHFRNPDGGKFGAKDSDMTQELPVLGGSVGPLYCRGPIRFLADGIQSDEIDLPGRPARIVEMIDDRGLMKPLRKEGGPHRGIGQVDSKRGGPLKMARILVDAVHPLDQKAASRYSR